MVNDLRKTYKNQHLPERQDNNDEFTLDFYCHREFRTRWNTIKMLALKKNIVSFY